MIRKRAQRFTSELLLSLYHYVIAQQDIFIVIQWAFRNCCRFRRLEKLMHFLNQQCSEVQSVERTARCTAYCAKLASLLAALLRGTSLNLFECWKSEGCKICPSNRILDMSNQSRDTLYGWAGVKPKNESYCFLICQMYSNYSWLVGLCGEFPGALRSLATSRTPDARAA